MLRPILSILLLLLAIYLGSALVIMVYEGISFGSANLEVAVNNSLVETLGRSMNTALTTLFAIIALLLFVGGPIQNFAVVLLVGIIAGTYSSICIASSLLVVWEKREWGRFLPGPLRSKATARSR